MRGRLAVVEDYPGRDTDCSRCRLSEHVQTVCMGGDGRGGGTLVVGQWPGEDEDSRGKVMVGRTGSYMRQFVQTLELPGPVRYTNVIRCFPHKGLDPKEQSKVVAACAGFLRTEIRKAKPKHILAMGEYAIWALAGERLGVDTVRGGGAWYEIDGKRIPVSFVQHVAAAKREKGARLMRWRKEVKAALTGPPVVQWGNVDDIKIRVAKSEEQATGWLEKLSGRMVMWDIEAAAAKPGVGILWHPDSRLLCVGFAFNGESSYVIPERHLPTEAFRRWVRSHGGKGAHNAKFDIGASTLVEGVSVTDFSTIDVDTAIWRRLTESAGERSLEALSYLVGMGGYKWESMEAVSKTRLPPEMAFGEIPEDILHKRNGLDTVATYRLYDSMRDSVKKLRSWTELLQPAIRTYINAEATGIAVDTDRLERLDRKLTDELDRLSDKLGSHKEVVAMVEERGAVNLRSPPQLQELLFQRMRLPVLATTKKTRKPSTDKSVLEVLANRSPFVRDLIKFRRVGKLHGTYAKGLAKLIRADGRIHTTINLDGAATGRPSSEKPNLQNIVTAEEDEDAEDTAGREIRSCFVADPGHVLMELDYSQLEIYTAAFLSQDENMIRVIRGGKDFHTATAADIFGVDFEDVTKDMRRVGKDTVFGVLFGETEYGLAQKLGVPEEKAMGYVRGLFSTYPKLGRMFRLLISECRKTGEVWTWWNGSRCQSRVVPDILSSVPALRAHSERMVKNTPIQGTAAYFAIASANEVDRRCVDEGRPYRFLLSVHDSLLLSVERAWIKETALEVRNIMTGWDSRGLPLKVGISFGPDWGNMKPLKLEE